MGTHGSAGHKEWALNSMTAAMAQRAGCPVLTVPDRPSANGSAPNSVRRVLCTVDLGASSTETAGLALAFARAFGARLELVHVLEWLTGRDDLMIVPELHLDAAEEARRQLALLLLPDATNDPGVGVAVAAGTPHQKILRLAREQRADLVVLGAHGRRSLDRSLPGVQLVHL